MERAWHPPIFQTVPADEFTDREEIIGRLMQMAARAPRDMTLSTATVGRRRLGKTAVLEQAYNRLFWEQDAVVPIYFTFEARPVTSTEFAVAYFTNFLRQFIAFRRKDDALVRMQRDTLTDLVQMAQDLGEESLAVRAEIFADFLEHVESPGVMHQLLECAIALFGRFRFLEFPPLEDIYALELVDKLAHKYGLQIAEPVAGYLVTRCGGSPFYIGCTILQAREQGLTAIPDEAMVHNLIAHEVTHGQIWRDWSGQLQKYFERINTHFIAKAVLFHAAQFGDQLIEPELIAQKVKQPVEEVQRVLQQLAFAEMIDASGGYLFRNLKDPILRDFIKVQYQLDVALQPFTEVLREVQRELARWKGKYADAVGELVEARINALMTRFDGRRVPGRLFGVAGEVELPKFTLVYDTVVKGPGDRMRQVDLAGSWWHGDEETMWVVEIKQWARRVDVGVVREFAELCQAVSQDKKVAPERLVKWLVNHVLSEAEGAGGFTEGALEAMQEAGIMRSGAAEINELLRGFGLQRLLGDAAPG
jgi:hypothetical protein